MRKVESEKVLEARLREEIKKRGGMAVKLTSQFHRGLPDRMVLLPGGLVHFVELKTTGEKPTLLQQKRHSQLRELGFSVSVISGSDGIDDFLFVVDWQLAEGGR